MHVVEVNLVDTEALQTLLARFLDVLWVASDSLFPASRNAELSGKEYLVALASTLEPAQPAVSLTERLNDGVFLTISQADLQNRRRCRQYPSWYTPNRIPRQASAHDE